MIKLCRLNLAKFFAAILFFYLQSLPVFSQQKISGVVIANDNNLPLSLVSVIVKGTNTATMTDGNGFFHISASRALRRAVRPLLPARVPD